MDVFAGIIPIIGDIIDNLFKANLRNLALLETWLLTDPSAQRFHILVMPETTDFMPKPKAPSKMSSWFGGGTGISAEEAAERVKESQTGKVRKTRRMGKDEVVWEVPVGTSTSTSTELSGAAGSSKASDADASARRSPTPSSTSSKRKSRHAHGRGSQSIHDYKKGDIGGSSSLMKEINTPGTRVRTARLDPPVAYNIAGVPGSFEW